MRKIGLLLLLVITTSCLVQVKTYQKPDTNFNDYQTWSWLKGNEITYQGQAEYNDPRVTDEIVKAITANMNRKGYRESNNSPDLVVNYHLVVEQGSREIIESVYELDYESFPLEDNWMNETYPEYIEYLKGSFVIDVIDRGSSELIWRSNAIRYADLNSEFNKDRVWKGGKENHEETAIA